MAKQFVVQLKNEPGAMATLAEALAARGVDLRAIGGGSMGDSGHVIMTTADDEATKAVLDDGGYTYIEGESILAEVDDRPGGMARLSRALADAGVNITATCSSVGGAIARCSRSSSTSPTSPARSSNARADRTAPVADPERRGDRSGVVGYARAHSCSMGAPVSAPVSHRPTPIHLTP